MKITFVTENESQKWILRRWCEEWVKHIPDSHIAAPDYYGVNVFVNYDLYKPVGKTISVFTHKEKDKRAKRFDEVAEKSNWCFAQSINTLMLLPSGKSSTLKPGIGGHYYKDIVLGVVGRHYSSGRKRFEWIEELEEIDGVTVKRAKDVAYEDMPTFYDSIDYLVVTADNEGGPMPVLEAMARGKTVIAPNVGWCWEYPGIRYDGTLEDLKAKIKELVLPRNMWEIGAKQIVEVANLISK